MELVTTQQITVCILLVIIVYGLRQIDKLQAVLKKRTELIRHLHIVAKQFQDCARKAIIARDDIATLRTAQLKKQLKRGKRI